MSLDVYFQSDIANIVTANTLTAILASAASGAVNVEFVRGALCQAQSTCLAFGIDWPAVLADLRNQARIGGWVALLDVA